MSEYFGTPKHKLARKDDPETSKEAAATVDTTRLEQLVYDTIKMYGDEGCIADDVLRHLHNFAYSSVTARFSALFRKEYIWYKGDKRRGKSGRNQRVMRAI